MPQKSIGLFVKLLSTVIIVFIFNCCSAQNDTLTTFYSYIYKGVLCNSNEDFKGCLQNLQKAEKIKGLGPQQYLLCADAFFALKDTSSGILYIEKAITHGFREDQLNNFYGQYKKPNSDSWRKLKRSYGALRKQYLNKLDLEYRDEIQDMLAIDEFARTNSDDMSKRKILNGDTGNYYFIKVVDSLNAVKLKTLITTKGFPDSKKIGYSTGLEVVIAHIVMEDESVFKFMDSVMLKVVERGEFSGDDYAWIIDRRRVMLNIGNSLYGGYENPDDFGIIDNIKNVDKRRAKIYLPSLKLHAEIMRWELPVEYKNSKLPE
jgi:hypothetical protein